MPSVRGNSSGTGDPRQNSNLNESKSTKPIFGLQFKSPLITRRDLHQPNNNTAQVRVFNVDRDRLFASGGKYSSPNDTDSPVENQENSRRRTYKRKHRRCWDTSRTALHQDSGSDSAPLLSSASHTSAGPVMFPNSETSELDDSPIGGSPRYGSIGAASFNSVVTVLPKRLPSLIVQDNIRIISDSGNLMPGLHLTQQQCYEIRDMEMVLSSEKYENNEPSQATGEICREYDRINLASTLEIRASLHLDSKPKQSSIITIFSIWNTILGSSLLTMPWGILMAGLAPGLMMLIIMSGLCLYTAHRLLKVHKYHGGDEKMEVPELCKIYLGSFADHVARLFSITVLLGANIAYWILMSNVLYNSVNFFYDNIAGHTENSTIDNVTHLPEVLCPKEEMFNYSVDAKPNRSYDNLGPIWDLYRTVPLFLALVIFPLLNFNTTTFFTKFNSLGTAAIIYLIAFVITKSSRWGINMSTTAWENSWRLQSTFPALTGMLTMAFFIHNIIITIMQHNRDQSKNGRDLSIAYTLVTLSYLAVGPIFYISFPIAKFCIEDNFLNNFQKWDALTVGARIVLLFQLLTVYPLINYMLRIRLLSITSPFANSTRCSVIIVNLFVVAICVLFARYLPYIGTVIRYTGAISGMVYIFTLPSILHLAILYKKRETTIQSLILHLSIPIIGAANLVGQLFVSFN